MIKGINFKKVIYIVYLGLLLSVGLLSLSYMENAMQEQIISGSDVPFTIVQVETMMRYHGASIARFDGKNWWFLNGNSWINITNGNAFGRYIINRSKERRVALEGRYRRRYKDNGGNGALIL